MRGKSIENSMAILNIEERMTFYRHWLWADFFKNEFIRQVRGKNKEVEGGISLFYGSYGAFMFTWYGMVYSLIEFMNGKKIIIPEIKRDIKKVRERLRLCRNGVFHVRAEIGFEKLFKMISPGGSFTINRIHESIGSHIQEALARSILGVSPNGEGVIRKIIGTYLGLVVSQICHLIAS